MVEGLAVYRKESAGQDQHNFLLNLANVGKDGRRAWSSYLVHVGGILTISHEIGEWDSIRELRSSCFSLSPAFYQHKKVMTSLNQFLFKFSNTTGMMEQHFISYCNQPKTY